MKGDFQLKEKGLLSALLIDEKTPATQAGDPARIAEMKRQMIGEKKDSLQAATGHNFGSSQSKLVGVHILEMYNPLKNFFA